MKRPNALTSFAIIMTTVMLTACGFHLRGSALRDSMPFKSIFVSVSDSSTIGTTLKRNLRAGGTIVTPDPKTAEVMMEVLSEEKKKSILSLNAQGRVREYGLNYTLRFQVRDQKGNVILAPTAVQQTRKYNYTESDASARSYEESQLYDDMQYDLVQQVLRRLAAIKLNPETK